MKKHNVVLVKARMANQTQRAIILNGGVIISDSDLSDKNEIGTVGRSILSQLDQDINDLKMVTHQVSRENERLYFDWKVILNELSSIPEKAVIIGVSEMPF